MNDVSLELFLADMARDVAAFDRSYSVDGAQKLTVQLPDKTFRVKPVSTDVEFLLETIRIGASNVPLFCFTPEDAQEYERVEVKASKLDEVFPLLTEDIHIWAVNQYGKHASLNDALDKSAEALLDACARFEQTRLKEQALVEEQELKHLPMQGIF